MLRALLVKPWRELLKDESKRRLNLVSSVFVPGTIKLGLSPLLVLPLLERTSEVVHGYLTSSESSCWLF